MSKEPSFISELIEFIRIRKLWWLAPIFILLAIIGVLILLAQTTALSQFVYAFI
ncbi:MAG: DUF5989 family protein [Candidatus Anstonellales archaeon]